MPPKTKKSTSVTATPVVTKQEELVAKPIELSNDATVDLNLEKLKQEWLKVIQEVTLIECKREQLCIRREELVKLMMKQMNSSESSNPTSSIIETPTVEPIESSDVKIVVPTSKSKSKVKVESKVEPKVESKVESKVEPVSTVKKTKKQPAKKEEIEPVKQEETVKPTKPTKKKVAEPVEPAVSKTTKSKKVEPVVQKTAVSSSSDTDLESLSSCSSESECSGGDED
jgi:hypothetical protein